MPGGKSLGRQKSREAKESAGKRVGGKNARRQKCGTAKESGGKSVVSNCVGRQMSVGGK